VSNDDPSNEPQCTDFEVTALDAELLGQFVARGDESAFAELVQRHGGLVMGICRQLLRCSHDAEDAFQATFFIFARRASSIQKSSSAAGWLQRVAYRTAWRLGRQRLKRHEQTLTDDHVILDHSLKSIEDQDLSISFHEELAALPERYRSPLVLCCLEGKSRNQAAELLECTEAAVKARLARGRKLLRLRLARRGVTFTAAFVAVCQQNAQTSAAVSGELILQTAASAAQYAHHWGTSPSSFVESRILQIANAGVKKMMLDSLFRPGVAAIVLVASIISVVSITSQFNPAIGGDTEQDRSQLTETFAQASSNQNDSDATVTVTSSDLDVAAGSAITAEPAVAAWYESANRSGPIAAPQMAGFPSVKELQFRREVLRDRIKIVQLKAQAKRLEATIHEGTDEDSKRHRSRMETLNATAAALEFELDAKQLEHEAGLLEEQMERAGRATASASPPAGMLPRPPAQPTPSPNYGIAAPAAPVPPAVAQPPVTVQLQLDVEENIAPGTLLEIRCANALPEAPIDGLFMVERSGKVALGPLYGRCHVAGKTLEQAEEAIRDRLRDILQDPKVMVTLPIPGEEYPSDRKR
jgi:RNA polymerase sigma factor (sigma-70 family)